MLSSFLAGTELGVTMEIQIIDLKKNYGKKQALKGVSMTLTEGIYGLVGPNGAGKSTLMNILTGNLTQNDGQIFFDGDDIRTLGSSFRARLGYMPQQQTYYPTFTVEQFLYYIGSLRGMKRCVVKQRMDWTLELLTLTDVQKKQIRSLSGGMRQRLLLAQAILDDPDILILDEPTAGLDPKQRIAVRNLISEIALHKIVLISTHVVSDVEFVAKELILQSKGKVLRQASPRTLTQELQGKVWEVTISEDKLSVLSDHGTISALAKDGEGITVRLLAAQKPPYSCTAVRPTLEDVYLYHFGLTEEL